MYWYKWLAVLGTASVFILCDSLSAQWGKRGDKVALGLMIVISPLGYACFGWLNQSTTLSAASGMVNMFLLMGTVAVGVFYFNDELTYKQYVGLAFALIAIILLAPDE